MTMPFGGSVRSVEYGRPDGSASPRTASSGANGTFALMITCGWVGVAGAAAWSAYQPGSGRKPTPSARAAVPVDATKAPSPIPNATATTTADATTSAVRRRRGRRRRTAAKARARAIRDASGPGSGSVSRTSRSRRSRSGSDDTLLLEDGAQLGLRAREPRGDSADRQPEDAGDLVDRQVEPVVEDDDNTLPGPQRGDGIGDRPLAEGVLGRVSDRPGVKGRLLVLQHLHSAPLAELVDGAVDRDSLQPRPQRARLVEAVQGPESFLDRLLRRVVRES